MSNKVIIHVCGGGAYNAMMAIKDKMFFNFKGIPDLELHYIDTTNINIVSHGADDMKFYKISSVLSGSENEVSGSGGDRSTHLDSKISGIREYIKENKWIKNESGTFHFVIFTCGGGSGSTLGSILIKELKLKDITVIPFAIGDSTSFLTASNTFTTLAGLDKIVRELKTNLTMFYYDNGSADTGNITKAEDTVNRMLLSDINLTSVFLSTSKSNIDNADMHMFLDQSKYTGKYKAEPGLMELTYVSDDYKPSSEVMVTMVRTLLKPDSESELNLEVIQRKVGVLTDEHVVEKLKSYKSINLVTLVNSFKSHVDELKEKLERRQHVENARIAEIEGEDILDI